MMASFTIHHNVAIDREVECALALIVAALEQRLSFISLYLIGGFGRGEGTVRYDGKRWIAVNDYDLLVITDDCTAVQPILQKLSQELAVTLGIDFVDLGCQCLASLATLPPTMQNYDFKYGSRLLKGADVRSLVPEYKPEDLPPYEFIRLLCNRAAGILTSRLPERSALAYRAHQYLKMCIAVGDAAVFLGSRYDCSYQVRSRAFGLMNRCGVIPFTLTQGQIKLIESAYRAKLSGDGSDSFYVDDNVLKQMVTAAYCALAGVVTKATYQNISGAENALWHTYRHSTNLWQDATTLIKRIMRQPVLLHRENAQMRILLAQPVFYVLDRSMFFGLIWRFWRIPGILKKIRQPFAVVRLWEAYNH